MNVLIGCEESQRVCIAFREKGHNAFSCDIIEPSGNHPEWHIQCDVLQIINGGDFQTLDGKEHNISKWNLIIAHPPCTYLTNAGARHLYKNYKLNIPRYEKGLKAKEFFMKIYNSNCDRICIENPVPSKIFELPKYTQIIQPYYFGEPYTKRTCIWLKNLPPLKPTNQVTPIASFCPSGKYSYTHDEKYKGIFTKDRAKQRSKTFKGIALAMAEQWG